MLKNQVEVKRYQKPRHFVPAVGYNCPHFPAPLNKCDYEVVRVVKTGENFKNLKGRLVIMSWGLNLSIEKAQKLTAFVTCEELRNDYAEMLLAVM